MVRKFAHGKQRNREQTVNEVHQWTVDSRRGVSPFWGLHVYAWEHKPFSQEIWIEAIYLFTVIYSFCCIIWKISLRSLGRANVPFVHIGLYYTPLCRSFIQHAVFITAVARPLAPCIHVLIDQRHQRFEPYQPATETQHTSTKQLELDGTKRQLLLLPDLPLYCST